MDPVTTSAAIGSLDKIGAQHGFNAVLVLVLIAAIAIIVWTFLRFLREERTDARAERKEDRSEHLAALGAVTGELKELRRDLTAPVRRVGGD